MSDLITSTINKNRKKFTPTPKKRKRMTIQQQQQQQVSKEPVTPTESSHPIERPPTETDNLSIECLDTEYMNQLACLYPGLNRKAQKSLKRPLSTPDYITPDLDTPEKRRNQLEFVQEKILSENDKYIFESNKRKRLRRGQEQLNQKQLNRKQLNQSELVPQARIEDGEISLDPSSLSVTREVDIHRAIEDLMDEQDIVLRLPWSELEIQVFYDGLALYGTDFQAIANTLIGRTRKSVRNKFNTELIQCPKKVNSYLMKKSFTTTTTTIDN
ncbi:hypothetical protein BD770DRAFT_443828 [Pilaira anomala]|nr:hypothetical protein BD770DRAFT_443828 [Pilaira anomala]